MNESNKMTGIHSINNVRVNNIENMLHRQWRVSGYDPLEQVIPNKNVFISFLKMMA